MLLQTPAPAAPLLLGLALATISCSALLDTDALQEGSRDSAVLDGAVAEAGRDSALVEQGLDAPLPDQLVADQALPDQALPDQALPDQRVDDLALPDQQLDDQGIADQALPDQLVDDQAVPDQQVNDQAIADQGALDLLAADQAAGDLLADLPSADASSQDSALDGLPDGASLADGTLDGTQTATLLACTLRDAQGGPAIETTDIIEAFAVIDPPSAGIQLRWTLWLVEAGHPQEGELATDTVNTDQTGQTNFTYYNLALIFPAITPGSGRLLSRWEFVQTQEGSGSCVNQGDISAP